MRTNILFTGALVTLIMVVTFVVTGCAASESVASKPGAQLWSENCLRCHNAPDPADYSDKEWDAVGAHMQLRAISITDAERDRIVEFLKSAN